MISQLRIYTINRGMMDSWLKLFEEHIRPIPEKEAAYFASPGRSALGDLPTSHIAKMEVRVIEKVPVAA